MNLIKKRLRTDGKTEIFDIVRAKYVLLTEEEAVRQQLIHFFIEEKKVPKGCIGVEQSLKVLQQDRRTDVVIYNLSGKATLLAECKAPNIVINQNVFEQIARYNMTLQVKYLLVSNGLASYCCEMDYEKNSYYFLTEIPDWEQIKNS